ncbi:MAG TPA: peptide ABC transporter substrate-binding protein [Gaiellaceae bacterium]
MHRRFWLFAGIAAALVAASTSATATAKLARGKAASLRAAPFAQAWANVPRSPAARKARGTLVFAGEQDPSGFNGLQSTQSSAWAVYEGNTPVIRGIYVIDQNGEYHLDLATSVKADRNTLDIKIRPTANWMWGSKKMPVTADDFIYTWKALVDPKNQVTSNTGYINIGSATKKGPKEVVFHWTKSCSPDALSKATCAVGAFADYRDLFGLVYPSAAINGLDWNSLWGDCVCGTDGKPVSDGPFYVSNWTKGQGVTLKKNPGYYGHKAQLNEIDWKFYADTNSEIQAIKTGEVDAAYPSPQTALGELKSQPGLVYKTNRAYIMEHIDIQLGSKGNPLLRNLWMRQAISLAINRVSLIKAIFSSYAPGVKPLNSLEYILGKAAVPHFGKYATSQKKAVALLKAHCTGGPSAPTRNNSNYWTCGGQKAEFKWYTTTGNSRRAASAAIFQQQLQAVGIKINPEFQPGPSVLFGQTLPAHDYDLAEYAYVFGSPDPSSNDGVYKTGSPGNYTSYSNKKVDKLLQQASVDFNPASRQQKYEQVDAQLSNDLPIFPLYTYPSILIYRKAVKGMENSDSPVAAGPAWNAELWHF